jgi:hypothetical protein
MVAGLAVRMVMMMVVIVVVVVVVVMMVMTMFAVTMAGFGGLIVTKAAAP